MPQLQCVGASVHYEALGEGPPLLLLAGIASDGASWGPLLPLLQARFRLILIDNRGSGRSRCEGDIAVEDMVDDCAALLDHLGIAQAFVAGHSMGGMLGQRLAARHPERVKALVTMTTSDRIGAKERVLFQDLAKLYFEMQPQTWFRLLFQWLFSEPFFQSEENVAVAAEASAAYVFRQSPEDFLRQVKALEKLPEANPKAIQCPVLAIAAGADLLIPPAAVERGHKGIADVRMVTIADVGHSVHWEAPEAVARAIVEFLV
ncbi:MAG: alpha/beta fold hydrolase [Devosia sp.]|nr:alpha/beta fold hydrolase [Devosia sp.]